MLHNAAVLAAVAVANTTDVSETWKMYEVGRLGVPTLLYVAFSGWLGVSLVQASRLVQRECALEQIALS